MSFLARREDVANASTSRETHQKELMGSLSEYVSNRRRIEFNR